MKQLFKKFRFVFVDKELIGATKEQVNAIIELEHYNDRELADIGLTRSDIRRAVLRGL